MHGPAPPGSWPPAHPLRPPPFRLDQVLVDGGQVFRTFCAVEDACEAVMAMVSNPDKSIGHTFNVGNPDNNIRVSALAELMIDMYSKMTGKPKGTVVKISGEEYYGKGYEDSDLRIPSMTLIKRQLGWEPKTSLKTAMGACPPRARPPPSSPPTTGWTARPAHPSTPPTPAFPQNKYTRPSSTLLYDYTRAHPSTPPTLAPPHRREHHEDLHRQVRRQARQQEARCRRSRSRRQKSQVERVSSLFLCLRRVAPCLFGGCDCGCLSLCVAVRSIAFSVRLCKSQSLISELLCVRPAVALECVLRALLRMHSMRCLCLVAWCVACGALCARCFASLLVTVTLLWPLWPYHTVYRMAAGVGYFDPLGDLGLEEEEKPSNVQYQYPRCISGIRLFAGG